MVNKIPKELEDFRNFVYLAWEHLGLDPTPIQYDIAQYIQNGPRRRTICAFRGAGKSFLTSAYACWRLLLNPQLNILVVSASKTRADDFSIFTQRLIFEMPLLKHLIPKESQRTSKIAFDVGPAKAAHAPSVKSVGITGQLTGSRADIIIADDVESLNNSATQGQRDKLGELVREFEAIIKPGGEIIFLGTPQTEMSLYQELPPRGYKTQIWPARYPTEKLQARYGETLASIITKALEEDEENRGEPTDAKRFSDWELKEREASYGRAGFALQFMLDPSLSDIDRYPLKLSDLIVLDLDSEVAPEKLVWAGSPDYVVPEVPNVGFSGDTYHKPMVIQGDWLKYTGSVMAIDPSGRGKDETAYSIVKILNGFIYVHACEGLTGGYDENTLEKLAKEAKKHKVNFILVESNFGDGMFTELLKPYLRKIYPVTIEEIRHNIQKERRILDTLEPVMNQHKLVIDTSLIDRDYKSTEKYPPEKQSQYRLFHQMTRLTRDRGSLNHDDRLDVLAMAVGYFVESAGLEADEAIKRRKDELLDKELRRIEEGSLFDVPGDHKYTWM